eukprot:2569529-Lingulodinium_polyedra.AAC.1
MPPVAAETSNVPGTGAPSAWTILPTAKRPHRRITEDSVVASENDGDGAVGAGAGPAKTLVDVGD